MKTNCLKDGVFVTNINTGDKTGSTNKTAPDARDDVAVEVRHKHHIELLWMGNHLHRRIVHNHRLELDLRVFVFCYLSAHLQNHLPHSLKTQLLKLSNIYHPPGNQERLLHQI